MSAVKGKGAGGEEGSCLLLDHTSSSCPASLAGGKGHNLWELGRIEGCQVPEWFCITTDAFTAFIEVYNHPHKQWPDMVWRQSQWCRKYTIDFVLVCIHLFPCTNIIINLKIMP